MDGFRAIPSVEQVRQRPSAQELERQFGREALVEALRTAAGELRSRIARGDRLTDAPEAMAGLMESMARAGLALAFRPSLAPVINATGVVLHTNLGRAPLASAALARAAEVAAGYSTLEYDLASGARGRRDVHAEALLTRLTGAEAAVVVNNNAAATMLVLAALSAGRETIVSRGELVEIGGGFRVPDVMAQSGANLREVGTTNRTRASDYAAAIGPRTALVMRIHPSNFRLEGFTATPALADLVAVAHPHQVAVVDDLGSGLLDCAPPHPLAGVEPTVTESLAAGVDVCCFSGDKLLGGPQAGLIVGRRALLEKIRRHPLMRALRVDKLTYAALEATLAEYAAGRAAETVPVQRMLTTTPDQLHARANSLAATLDAHPRWATLVVEGRSAVGGGSAPGVTLPTALVALSLLGATASALESRLRQSAPPVIARIENDRVVLDLRTVAPDQDAALAALLLSLAS